MAFLSLLCSVFTSDLLTLDLTLNKSCIHLFLSNPEWIDLCVTKTYLRSYMHRSLRICSRLSQGHTNPRFISPSPQVQVAEVL